VTNLIAGVKKCLKFLDFISQIVRQNLYLAILSVNNKALGLGHDSIFYGRIQTIKDVETLKKIFINS